MSGGGGSSTPSNTTQTQELPAWARGYAQDVLAKGAALTNINNNPYVKYRGERLAGFDPMQQQSFAGARGMQVAPQIGQATQYATQAGRYTPVGQQYTGANVGQYMNPFLENALAPQLRKAAEAGRMAQQEQAAKAVGMGAFGGTRGALQQSMVDQNTRQNLSDINAQGYSDAFNQAANMFNTDQARRIQEAQFGNSAQQQAAQLLGQLGGQQFQQGMDINKLLNTYGAQQQAQQQRADDIAYQNFMDQQNYAYKQLGFMSDLIKNPAIGSRNQTLMYEAAPNTLSTLAGLGTGAAALAAAKGGIVGYAGGGSVGYAGGGGISEILPKLSDEQLDRAEQEHPELAQEIQMEKARRAEVRGGAAIPPMEQGLGAAPAGPMPQMAGGGIVAFADEGLVKDPLALTKLFKQRVPDRMPDRPPLTAEEVRAALAAQDSGSGGMAQRLGRGVYDTVADIPSALAGISSALANRPSQVGGMNIRYAPEPAAKKVAANAPAPAPAPAAPDKKATVDASSSESSRLPGLAGAASAFKLPTFDTKEQSVTDIGKELEPFMAQRRKENAELLKPEQTAVNALLQSIEDRKKGDVKEQLLGISAAFLSSKSPYFAPAVGDAIKAYSGATGKQKADNAKAVKEATDAQIALGRYRVALDKNDEATAAKYKEIATNKANKAMEHQLTGLGLGIQSRQADNQAAHYAAINADSKARLKMLQDASTRDIKVGQAYTTLQNQVQNDLKTNTAYTMEQDPLKKQAMFDDLLRSRMAGHPLLGPYAGGVGLSASAGGDKVFSLVAPAQGS